MCTYTSTRHGSQGLWPNSTGPLEPCLSRSGLSAPRRGVLHPVTAMRTVAWVLALCLALVACSTAATPVPRPNRDPDGRRDRVGIPIDRAARIAVWRCNRQSARRPLGDRTNPDRRHQDLDGRGGHHRSRRHRVDLGAGLALLVSFLLEFSGTTFRHSTATLDMPMQVDESGTFALSGSELVLTIGEPGNIDTYTFQTMLAGDELSLRWGAYRAGDRPG